MNRTWLTQRGAPDVVIIMLGWAATPQAVMHLQLPGCDVLAVHHYTDGLEPLRAAEFAAYRRVYLVAWSYGVWAAEQCCRELPLHRAIAFNGTPFPADERYGMRLRASLRAMQAAAHGSLPTPAELPGPYPEPTPAEKLAELTRLAEWSRRDSAAHLRWHAAYIADQDEIFPPARMRAYWQSVGLGTEYSGRHYPFADPALLLRALDLEEEALPTAHA